jgi:hypothetical protein
VHHEPHRHLVTVADIPAAEQPELAERYAMPKGNETNETFRTLARRLLVQGQAETDVLAKHGLADKLLEDLAAAVAELRAVSDGVMHEVGCSGRSPVSVRPTDATSFAGRDYFRWVNALRKIVFRCGTSTVAVDQTSSRSAVQ